MILDAYYKNLATQMCGNPNSFTFKDQQGAVRTHAKITSTSSMGTLFDTGVAFHSLNKVNTNTNYVYGVVFGDGTAEVSKDDYKLSGNVISTISASATLQNTLVDGQAVISAIYMITNTGSAPITISEVGYYGGVAYNSSQDMMALLERTLLDTPITISAGGVGQVTYTIRMNYPT